MIDIRMGKATARTAQTLEARILANSLATGFKWYLSAQRVEVEVGSKIPFVALAFKSQNHDSRRARSCHPQLHASARCTRAETRAELADNVYTELYV